MFGLDNLIGAVVGNKAQKKAQRKAVLELREGRKKALSEFDPYSKEAGTWLSQLRDLMANPSSVMNTPAAQFRFSQGLNSTQNMLSKMGLQNSNALQAITNYGQKASSQEYENEFNRLFGLNKFGANIASNRANIHTGSSAQISNLEYQRGQNIAEQANQMGKGFNSLFEDVGTAIFGGGKVK